MLRIPEISLTLLCHHWVVLSPSSTGSREALCLRMSIPQAEGAPGDREQELAPRPHQLVQERVRGGVQPGTPDALKRHKQTAGTRKSLAQGRGEKIQIGTQKEEAELSVLKRRREGHCRGARGGLLPATKVWH